jgi:hypothetical protein
MNPLLKFAPLLMNSKLFSKNKKWLVVAGLVLGAYQLLNPNGVGAQLGVPSFDTFYLEPRDVLVKRVAAASEAQQETAEEFKSALEKFKAVTNFDGGDLEKMFKKLNGAYESSEESASIVSQRVDNVVNATNTLLKEWRKELDQYHDASIKARAEKQFDATRLQANNLISAMRDAEQKAKPVLGAFKDQVLFIKHNLNMQAVSSLRQESKVIEQNVSSLIAEMEASIAEAEAFIKSIKR